MKTIGIIGAMPSELVDIRELLGKGDIDSQSAFEFHINHMDDKRIISVCCGIGKVNAAICTQTLISRFNVDCIINAGIAGGMDEKVKVCDIVISKDVMHHDLLSRFLDNYPPFNSNFNADEKLIEIENKVVSVINTITIDSLKQTILQKSINRRVYFLFYNYWFS